MKVVTLPITDSRWDDFVHSHAQATPFHLPEWASVIADCYRYDVFALAVCDTDREIVAGIPALDVGSPLGGHRWVSLAFSDSCDMLVRPDIAAEEVAMALREYVLAGPAGGLEVRGRLPIASDNVYPVDAGYYHTLALSQDPDSLRPNKGHRYSRNRAIRSGIQVTHANTADDISRFYRLHTLTRRRHGVPVQPRRFFDLIHDRLLAPGNGFVATATLDGEALASGIYLSHNGVLVAKYHASDPNHLDTGAGYLVDWETMVFACHSGYHSLDMGRSDPDADGLRLYKNSWGAVEEPLIYTHISDQPPPDHRLSVGELPKRIIRSSPPWVCRALGEALYRWSA